MTPFIYLRLLACGRLTPRHTHSRRRGLQNVEVQVRDLGQVWYREERQPSVVPELGDPSEMESYGLAIMANVLIAPVEDPYRHRQRNLWKDQRLKRRMC